MAQQSKIRKARLSLRRWLRSDAGKRARRDAGAYVVAAVAVYASYWHISETAIHAGQRLDIAYLLPVLVDGLLAVSGVYAMAPRVTVATRILAYLGFLAAWGASMVANVLSAGADASTWSRSVAAWPAIALALAAGIIHAGHRKAPTPAQRAARKAAKAGNARTVPAKGSHGSLWDVAPFADATPTLNGNRRPATLSGRAHG